MRALDAVRAAVAARDAGALACNYAADASVLDDQGILVGTTDITAAFFSLADLIADGTWTVTQQDRFRDTVRVLFSVDAGWFLIEDGVETYVVENGLIRRQSRHGLITFTGLPPDQQ